MECSSLTNPLATDLSDEALRRTKKKYKKRRSEASPECVLESGSVETTQEEAISDGPSNTVPLKGGSYRDRVAGNFPASESTWEDWIDADDGDESIMFEDSVSDAEDEEESDSHPSPSVQTTPQAKEDNGHAGYGPWMIVQRRNRRPVKEMVEKGKSKAGIDKGHDSRNRFNSLHDMKNDTSEKIKEPVVEINSKVKIGANVYGKKEWKPKKAMGNKITMNNLMKEGSQAKSKKSMSPLVSRDDFPKQYSVFEPSNINGPPPGFSFKAGGSKPITFDQQRLEKLVGDSSNGPLVKEGNIGSDIVNSAQSFSGEEGSAMVVDNTNKGEDMVLPSDAISLPPKQPPSMRSDGLVDFNSGVLNLEEKVVDESTKVDSLLLGEAFARQWIVFNGVPGGPLGMVILQVYGLTGGWVMAR
ncbi:hypothetical protein COLO4_12828 [Corchorus olitorius]|uniref:Uncharacterized protein n=1 Tax=Corchorus olitorius TaxID=93759 RepID=A0A1R3JZS3_9ROSI|nr:hypothetical protein COLO4_12828 [Corchorus olitorius]